MYNYIHTPLYIYLGKLNHIVISSMCNTYCSILTICNLSFRNFIPDHLIKWMSQRFYKNVQLMFSIAGSLFCLNHDMLND